MKLTLIARTYKNVLEGELYARTSNSMKVLCSVGMPSFSVSTWVFNNNVSNFKRWSFIIYNLKHIMHEVTLFLAFSSFQKIITPA